MNSPCSTCKEYKTQLLDEVHERTAQQALLAEYAQELCCHRNSSQERPQAKTAHVSLCFCPGSLTVGFPEPLADHNNNRILKVANQFLQAFFLRTLFQLHPQATRVGRNHLGSAQSGRIRLDKLWGETQDITIKFYQAQFEDVDEEDCCALRFLLEARASSGLQDF